MTEAERAQEAEAVAVELANHLLRALSQLQILECGGINAMACAIHMIARNSTDPDIRPGAITLLRQVADMLEAQDQLAQARANGQRLQ